MSLYLGRVEIAPLDVRPLTEAEWEQGLGADGVLIPSAEDLLYFRMEGVVYVASFAMETKLTDVVRRAQEVNDLIVRWGDREGRFLRSEDVENFVGRSQKGKS